MGSSRKRNRIRVFRKQRVQDEELGRFGRLVLGVLVFEAVVFVFVAGGFRIQ